MSNPFDDNRLYGARSALVKMIPDDQGRFQFELWSQYTRLGLDGLQVGDLVAVENYTPTEKNGANTYSVLTLNQVYPIHFAAQGTDAYPGHIFESMRSIKEDWEKQTDKPLHPTTTIISRAVSTGWQFKYSSRDEDLPVLDDERNLPMVGAEIMPLSMEMVEAIINKDMEDQPESPFTHKKFEEINVKLDKDALFTTHFGIFGFTGVGKSNLVSSMVDSLSSESARVSNLIIIDPNDEYLGLLIDKFVENPGDMRYIHVGVDSLPGPVVQNLGDGSGPSAENVELIIRQMKLPSVLKNESTLYDYMRTGIANALVRTRVVLPARSLGLWIRDEMRNQIESGTGAEVRDVLNDALMEWAEGLDQSPITSETIRQARSRYQHIRSMCSTIAKDTKRRNAEGVIDRTFRSLGRLETDLENIPTQGIISTQELIEELNTEGNSRIIIITAHRDSYLKRFVEVLGNELYESRRLEGRMEPSTVFLFDEADLFIPIDSRDEETERIKELCVTLARRGRKFGLGIGISTQRASLLDTEVMGNLHTYFVSKLPRSNDRQRVAEAFGIGEDQLSPTFTFRPGDWLIISHDATGLKGVPIPVSAYNANERILEAANEHYEGDESE